MFCSTIYFESLLQALHILQLKVTILLTPRLPDWPERGKRCVVGLIRKFMDFFLSFFIIILNQPLLSFSIEVHLDQKRFLEGFLFNKEHNALKILKLYKTLLCMLFTGCSSSDQPIASKAMWVTRIISSHISINLPKWKIQRLKLSRCGGKLPKGSRNNWVVTSRHS